MTLYPPLPLYYDFHALLVRSFGCFPLFVDLSLFFSPCEHDSCLRSARPPFFSRNLKDNNPAGPQPPPPPLPRTLDDRHVLCLFFSLVSPSFPRRSSSRQGWCDPDLVPLPPSREDLQRFSFFFHPPPLPFSNAGRDVVPRFLSTVFHHSQTLLETLFCVVSSFFILL